MVCTDITVRCVKPCGVLHPLKDFAIVVEFVHIAPGVLNGIYWTRRRRWKDGERESLWLVRPSSSRWNKKK